MSVSRRQFLAVTLGALAGCQATNGIRSAPGQERVVDAGPANRYRADGVYSAFRDQGFFLVCRDGKLFALSAICTHKKCKVAAEPDHSFYCPCHGSTFDPGGHVTQGPARRDLPLLPSYTDENGELFVKVGFP